jgi:hypothetical protein
MMFNQLIKIYFPLYFWYFSRTVFVVLVYCLKYRCICIILVGSVTLIVTLCNFFCVVIDLRGWIVVGRTLFLLSLCFPSGAAAVLGNQLLLYSYFIVFVLRFRSPVFPYIYGLSTPRVSASGFVVLNSDCISWYAVYSIQTPGLITNMRQYKWVQAQPLSKFDFPS